ncbi:uncharacterized protein LOC120347167 [Styela clava]
MEDDKWKIIDTHLHSMMDWTNGINSSNLNNQRENQRQGHIHRRSEPDVVMIRKAQASRINNVTVPQSAPVQPDTFALDWPARPIKKLPSCDNEPSINDIIPETPNLVNMPSRSTHNSQLNSATVTIAESHITMPHLSGSVANTDHVFTTVEAPPRPPPYPRSTANGSLHIKPNKSYFVPLTIDADNRNTSSNHHLTFSSIKNPPQTNSFGYGSPKTNRRSSVPGNQIDPRAHSASPNITRRSASHSAAVHRRRTQDNLVFIPTMVPNSEMDSNHIIIPSVVHSPIFGSTASPVSADPMMTNSTFTKKNDDQEYTKALLQHQQERMERLQKELEAKKKLLFSLSATLSEKETQVHVRRNEKMSPYMPTLSDVIRLRDANLQMEIDCNCMIKEVDMVTKSGNRVGGNFHEHISRKTSSAASIKKKFSNPPALGDLPSPPLPPPPVPPPLENEEETKWSCKYCTFLNHAALNKCEMCDYRRERTTAVS